MIECGPGVRRMGRSRAQYGEKKQSDRGDRAHELPLLKTDMKRLATHRSNGTLGHYKEFVGHSEGRNHPHLP